MKEKCPVSHKVKYVTHLKCVNWIKKKMLVPWKKTYEKPSESESHSGMSDSL